MTEPVAYRFRETNKTYSFIDSRFMGTNPLQGQPLYTTEQLHPRVKMTQAEFDEFKKLKSLNPTVDLIAILKIVSSFKYKNLQSRLVCSIENQTEFATLWLRGRYERLEELIEIVPTMKWFVRSKELNLENNYYYFVGKRSDDYWPTYGYKRAAKHFDTKEEAEKWKNPLTEAVQLPVEEIK